MSIIDIYKKNYGIISLPKNLKKLKKKLFSHTQMKFLDGNKNFE